MDADAVMMVNLALIVAFVLRFLGLVWLRGADWPASNFVNVLQDSLRIYLISTAFLTPLALVIFYLSGFYTHGRAYRGRYKALIILQAVTLTYLIFGALVYLIFHRRAYRNPCAEPVEVKGAGLAGPLGLDAVLSLSLVLSPVEEMPPVCRCGH